MKEKLLKKYSKHDIFLDLPIRRIKPPHNFYNFDKIIPFIFKYPNIRYLAISNVGSYEDIRKHVDLFHKQVCIVPKIETKKGVENISEICAGIIGEKIIMLDHDDLFSDLMKNNVPASKFFTYIEELVDFCNQNSVRLLKTRGVIFSDEDKYHF